MKDSRLSSDSRFEKPSEAPLDIDLNDGRMLRIDGGMMGTRQIRAISFAISVLLIVSAIVMVTNENAYADDSIICDGTLDRCGGFYYTTSDKVSYTAYGLKTLEDSGEYSDCGVHKTPSNESIRDKCASFLNGAGLIRLKDGREYNVLIAGMNSDDSAYGNGKALFTFQIGRSHNDREYSYSWTDVVDSATNGNKKWSDDSVRVRMNDNEDSLSLLPSSLINSIVPIVNQTYEINLGSSSRYNLKKLKYGYSNSSATIDKIYLPSSSSFSNQYKNRFFNTYAINCESVAASYSKGGIAVRDNINSNLYARYNSDFTQYNSGSIRIGRPSYCQPEAVIVLFFSI